MAEHRTRRRQRSGMAALVPIALLASSAVVYQASNAAFTASTSNGANNWASGSVMISDDDANSVLVNVSNLKPGDTATKCLNVTYSGSLASAVKLYASAYDNAGGLGQYLTFSVDEGTGAAGGASLDCTGFSSPTSLHSGTLDGLATARTSYASGASSWAPTGTANETRSYRFSWTLQDTNSAQGKSVSATFTWEARNT
jgi:hypothetical protein